MNNDLFKEIYLFESERKNQINASFGIPIAILTIEVGLVAYFAKPLWDVTEKLDALFFAFVATTAVAFFFLARCVYYLYRGMVGHIYEYIPSPKEISGYEEAMASYYQTDLFKDKTESEKQAWLEKEMSDFLRRKYISAAQNNISSNDSKSRSFVLSFRAVIFAAVWLIVSAVPFVIKSNLSPEITLVEVVNSKVEVKMADPKNEKPSNPPAKPPKEPDNRRLEEGAQPSEKK